jgi:3'(2'), 5'-bisphosphate nucleotidase
MASEAVILSGVQRLLPGVPLVSEESAGAARIPTDTFVVIDPLDGTREFIAGRDEYTVNIALIVDGQPLAGVVVAPALGLAWCGAPGLAAERAAFDAEGIGAPVAVRTRALPSAPVALVSRSHLDPASAALVARLAGVRTQPCGSAVKFCRLAEGAGDLYPRLAPTSEWDIAAGHALLAAAGGAVLTPDGGALIYGRSEAFRVPAFIACGDPEAVRRLLPCR